MKKIEAEPVLKFFTLLNKFQRVYRTGYMPGEDRKENDVEHSYTLALLTWYIIDAYELNLSKEKAIMYALAHDIPEVYAGDTNAFSNDSVLLESQDIREEAAREKLRIEFPNAPTIHKTMEDYEKREDPESIFVHALDKVHPVLIEMLQDGRTIKEEGLGYSRAVTLKRKVTAASPEVADLLEQLISLIDTDKERYFGEFID